MGNSFWLKPNWLKTHPTTLPFATEITPPLSLKKMTYVLYIRVGPVAGNQQAAQIFIKYMHDIVLEISFLDLNNGPNLSRSNLKLMQKSLKIQYIFQKFLCMPNRHNEANFLLEKFFWFRLFFDLFSSMMDQKNDPSQKSC